MCGSCPRLSQSVRRPGFCRPCAGAAGVASVTIPPMPKYQFDVTVLPEYLPAASAAAGRGGQRRITEAITVTEAPPAPRNNGNAILRGNPSGAAGRPSEFESPDRKFK